MKDLQKELRALKTKKFWLTLIAWIAPKLRDLLEHVIALIKEKNATISAISKPKKK